MENGALLQRNERRVEFTDRDPRCKLDSDADILFQNLFLLPKPTHKITS